MISCSPTSLNQQAACLECLDDKTLAGVRTYLMCQWANAGGGPPPGPSTPTNLLISNSTTNGNIILNWTAGGPAPTTYEVWVSINGGAYALLSTVGGGVTTYTDTNAMGASDQWYYEVRACDGATCSPFTDPAGIFNGFTHTVNTGLTDYTFPFLQFVIGDFFVQNQAAMTTVSVPKLRKCTGIFVVNIMPVLTSLVMTSLQTCTLFAASFNTVLTSVSVPALTATSAGGFFFGDCPALQFLSAPSLTTVVGDFDGRNNGVMVSIAAPLLATVSGDIFCRFASSLSSTDFTDLTSVANINFESSGGFACSFPSLTTVSGSMEFTGSSISSLDANSLTSIGGELNLASCGNLMTLSMTSLTTVGSDISIVSTALNSLDFPALTNAHGGFYATTNNSMTTLSAASLIKVDHDISTDNNALLNTINFPLLQEFGVATNLDWVSSLNPNLSTVDASSLAHATGGLDFDQQPLLTSLSFPALTLVDGDTVFVQNDTSLVTLSMPNVIFSNTTNFTYDATNCALDAASVNEILSRCVASGMTTCTIDLSGGTSAAPSGQGVIDKAALITAGNSVTTN